MSLPTKFRIAFSLRYRRPGCLLMQAALRGTVPDITFRHLFPSATWLTGSDPEAPDSVRSLYVFEVTEDELQEMSRLAAVATRGPREGTAARR